MDFDLNHPMIETTSRRQLFLDLNSLPSEEEEGEIQFEEEELSELDELLQELQEDVVTNSGTQTNRRKDLNNEQRKVVYNMLLQKSVDGKMKKHTTTEVASFFSTHIRTVQRIWKQGKESENGDVSTKRKNCGRKHIEFDIEKFRALELRHRSTINSIACALDVSTGVVWRLLHKGLIRRHSNAIKPFLKEENKRERLRFCLFMLEGNSFPHDPIFKSMYNVVHIDEKWFYMSQKKETYYLLPDEDEPLRTCKSKNFIVKVMFLAAVAHPRFDIHGNELFSGKIGIFPFVKREPAKRSSVNRVAGTTETKPMNSVKREDVRSFLIEKVIPSIKEKWPMEDNMRSIFIQQDNARTHVDPKDYEFNEAAKKDGFDIRLMCQPPNSPDLNILDLGFFNAIQSLQDKECPTTVDELVQSVIKSFEEFSTVKSNRIFLTLQQCMLEIMKGRGGHNYRMQHINKAKLERQGNLPISLKCDSALVKDVIQFLN